MCINMARRHTFVLLVVLPLLGLPVIVGAQRQAPTDTEDRLAKLEATLVKVLEKNDELEMRIVVLEEENRALHETVWATAQQKPESDIAGEGHVSKENQSYKKKAAEIVKQRHISQPRKRQLGPETVAFTATVSPPYLTVGPGDAVVYDSVITNVGGGYNYKTGVFTAPVSGVYTFNFAEMIDPGKNEYLELVKDGQHVIWNFGHASGASHLTSSSRTATVVVNQGNQLWVRTKPAADHGSGTIHGNTFTTFSGWIIAYSD